MSGVGRVGRTEYLDAAVDEGHHNAPDSMPRQHTRIEIAALDEHDGKGRHGAKSIELEPESARCNRLTEVSHGLSFDTRLSPNGVITCTQGHPAYRDTQRLESRGHSAAELAVVDEHPQLSIADHSRSDERGIPALLVAMRGMATGGSR